MNVLLRAARDNSSRMGTPPQWNDRLRENDPEFTRLDISAAVLRHLDEDARAEFLQLLPRNQTVRVVHMSGLNLEDVYDDPDDIARLVHGVGQLRNLQEVFVFRGHCLALNETLLTGLVNHAPGLKVLMMWGYGTLGDHPGLAGALRNHEQLERITITLPVDMPYASLDVYAMGFAEMQRLHCLNLRCQGKQLDPVISPEAISILLSSKSIESLYLENLGLIDDHTDAICAELRYNESLGLLDLKDNYLSDDALFTFAQTVPHNKTLLSLDLSGVHITERGGQALAHGMAANSTLTHLELEGTAHKYADEFDIKTEHDEAEWFKELDYQLRLNRAGGTGNRKKFVEALNSVSDHLGCLYTLMRQCPHYCDLDRKSPLT